MIRCPPLPVALAFLTTLVATAASAQENVNVGVYVPSLFFADSGAKADFITKVEAAIGAALGGTATATVVQDPNGLSKQQVWVTDATGFAGVPAGEALLEAVRQGDNAAPIAVYGKASWESAFALLSKGKISVPGGGQEDKMALRYWLLGDEPRSAGIVERIKGSRDARAALSTVAAGEGDGVLAYRADYARLDPKIGALKEITALNKVPLPVLALNTRGIDGATAERMRTKLRETKLPPVPGIIDGWRNATRSDYSRFNEVLRRRIPTVRRDYILADVSALSFDLSSLLPAPPAAPPLNADVVMPPARYTPLPDLPMQTSEPDRPVALAQ